MGYEHRGLILQTRYTTKKMNNNTRIVMIILWGLLTCLGLFMIARGIWALGQPWGVPSHKLFGLLFFGILLLFPLYQLIAKIKNNEKQIFSKTGKNIIYFIVSLAFVAGSLFIFLTSLGTDRMWAISGIVFFGLCTGIYLKNVLTKR